MSNCSTMPVLHKVSSPSTIWQRNKVRGILGRLCSHREITYYIGNSCVTSCLLFDISQETLYSANQTTKVLWKAESSGDSRERRKQGQTGDTLVTSIEARATSSTQTKVGVEGNQSNHFLTLGTLGGAFFLSNSLVFIESGKTGLNSHHPDCPLSPDEFVPIIAAGCKHTHLRWDGGTDLAENSFPRSFSLGYFPSGSVLLICSSTSYGSSCGSMKQGMTQGTYEQLWVGLMVA